MGRQAAHKSQGFGEASGGPHSAWYVAAMERLVSVVQALSQVREMQAIVDIVRHAARELTGADGATFILRDNDRCYYVDEDAISPLWKGQRFPMELCISGWVMEHRQAALIEDIYQDARIPHDAYRPTFVKSLAVVPIRRADPIGAIGNYWAKQHLPTDEEVALLQALADTTSVALENARLYGELQQKLRTLEESNYELSRFAWVASHDLQEPLRTIVTQVELLERHNRQALDARSVACIHTAVESAGRLQRLIDSLLVHARTDKVKHFRPLALGQVMDEVCEDLNTLIRETQADISYGALPWVWGDPTLLRRLMQNLLGNAMKFRQAGVPPRIRLSGEEKDGQWVCCLEDNGIGIAPEYRQQIFGLFQRLHTQDTYPGSGIGLATCKKILELHGGSIWVESQPGAGSRFYFTLPAPQRADKELHNIIR